MTEGTVEPQLSGEETANASPNHRVILLVESGKPRGLRQMKLEQCELKRLEKQLLHCG